jgi:hypothetical protein
MDRTLYLVAPVSDQLDWDEDGPVSRDLFVWATDASEAITLFRKYYDLDEEPDNHLGTETRVRVFEVPPGYRLPFTTVVVNQISFEHTHRDRAGFTWKEPMTLNIHVLAVRLDALRPANNDNDKAA